MYYSALALPSVSYTHKSGAALQIVSQLLTHKHLHHEIREKGGAYGAGAYAKILAGIFGFYSYRDPSPQATIKIMEDAGRWARDKEWTNQDIAEAKISVFQSLDAPKSVDEIGMTGFLSGITPEMEQTKREELLDVTKEDVREVAQKYLVNGTQNARLTVLGEEGEWLQKQGGWDVKKLKMVEEAIAGESDQ